jgi:hypothetical protein
MKNSIQKKIPNIYKNNNFIKRLNEVIYRKLGLPYYYYHEKELINNYLRLVKIGLEAFNKYKLK